VRQQPQRTEPTVLGHADQLTCINHLQRSSRPPGSHSRRNNKWGPHVPRRTGGRRHQRTGPARGRRPSHVPGRTGRAAGSGEGIYRGRRRNSYGPAAPAMVDVDVSLVLIGSHGPLTPLGVFEGCRVAQYGAGTHRSDRHLIQQATSPESACPYGTMYRQAGQLLRSEEHHGSADPDP
jgi:hypothetical protein